MFTGKPQKNRGAATTYFDEHLSHNDYYTQTETQAGQWIGVGCERLGLRPGEVVTRDAFLKLCDNLDPEAAVELQALRDGLAKLGFIRTERLEEKAASPEVAVRQHRQHRPMRQTRLSTVQRLATAVEDVRRWLDERLGIEKKETVAEKVGPAESVKQAEKIAPAVKETPGQKLRREIAQRRQQQHSQRRSGGIHI